MTKATRTHPHAASPHAADPSLHGSAPEDRPTKAIVASVGVLCLWLVVTVFSDPIARAVAELLTRIELRWIGGALPWTS